MPGCHRLRGGRERPLTRKRGFKRQWKWFWRALCNLERKDCSSHQGDVSKKENNHVVCSLFILLEQEVCVPISEPPRKSSFEPRLCCRRLSCYTADVNLWGLQAHERTRRAALGSGWQRPLGPRPRGFCLLRSPGIRQLSSTGWLWWRCKVWIFKCHWCI